MCGRFVQAMEIDDYVRRFHVDAVEATVTPSYNVAPTAEILGVVEKGQLRKLRSFSWGIVPARAGSRRVINARVETVATKPMFAEAFAARRCLVPADGYYEWQVRPGGKVPHHFRLADGEAMGLAGIWSRWRTPAGTEKAVCALLTTDAYPGLHPIHDRMPVMLDSSTWDAWLDGEISDPDIVLSLIRTVPEKEIEVYPVSTLVNNVRNDLPECVAPLRALPL